MHHSATLAKNKIIPSNLTLILLRWRIWWAPSNASKWQMGFNSAFKGLKRKKSWRRVSHWNSDCFFALKKVK